MERRFGWIDDTGWLDDCFDDLRREIERLPETPLDRPVRDVDSTASGPELEPLDPREALSLLERLILQRRRTRRLPGLRSS